MVLDMYAVEDAKKNEAMEVKPVYDSCNLNEANKNLLGVFDKQKQVSKQQKILQKQALKSPQAIAQAMEDQKKTHY